MTVHEDKFQQRVQCTHEVIYDIGATEGHPNCEEDLNGCLDKGSSPGHSHKKPIHLSTRDGPILQGIADGHIEVIGRNCEKDNLSSTKKMQSKDLSYTS